MLASLQNRERELLDETASSGPDDNDLRDDVNRQLELIAQQIEACKNGIAELGVKPTTRHHWRSLAQKLVP